MAFIIVVGNAISTSILLSKRFPQASTLPFNKPGKSGSSGWITCSAVVHNCSWSRTENFARGAIWLRGYVRRQILNVYSGRCFSWKTSRYYSATGNWPWVIIPWLYLLPGFFHLWSHQLGYLLHFSVLTKKEFVTVVTISLSTPLLLRVLLIASFGESNPQVYIIMKWEHEMTPDYWGHQL